MKKILALLAIAGLFFSCNKNDQPEETSASGASLTVTLNATSFAAGDTVVATVTDNSGSDVTRGDITLQFKVVNLDTNSYDTSMFGECEWSAVLGASDSSIEVEFPIRSDITETYSLRLDTSAEGCTITGSQQKITVSTGYVVELSIPGASDGKVKEGTTFTFTATTGAAPSEDMTITYTITDGENWFEPYTGGILIAAGETTGSSEEITVCEDGDVDSGQMTFDVTATASIDNYEVQSLTITRKDKDSPLGEAIDDERWVYDDPDQAFYSSDTESKYLTCPSYKQGDVLMTKYDYTTGTNGSPHPNATLAAEGWTLLNACEFHAIGGWSYPRPESPNTYGVYNEATAYGWSDQNTEAVEKAAFVNNTKYTNVTDDGYLRMWCCVDEGLSAKGTAMYVGTSSLYANKKNATMGISSNTAIGVGTRVEIRARLRGDRQGTLMALWMQGNAQTLEWPQYGEIDILENHVVIGQEDTSDWNLAEQTLHWGYVDDNSSPSHNKPTAQNPVEDIEEYNIYWCEIVDETTIKLGVNGETTRTFTKETTTNSHGDYTWPYTNDYNPDGFHVLLTIYAGFPSYTIGDTSWQTADFKNMSYEDSITSDVAPRMEIDWIRYWKNDNYDYSSMTIEPNSSAKMF